jgi:hypothetical protein
MNLSSSARSLAVTAAVAATAGFGLGAVTTSSSSAASSGKPARPVATEAEATYEHSRPNRMSVQMRRYLDGKGAGPQTGSQEWRPADSDTRRLSTGSPHVRILPHDVAGP